MGPTTAGDNNSSNDSCCSHDFKTCATWGNESREACESLTGMKWLENGPLVDNSCLARDLSAQTMSILAATDWFVRVLNGGCSAKSRASKRRKGRKNLPIYITRSKEGMKEGTY